MNEQTGYVYDLFISHADADRAWVEGYLLPALGLPRERIITAQNFRPGASKVAEFERAVISSRYILPVFSPAYVDDEWFTFSEQLASYVSVAEQRDRVIPLLLRPCDLPLHIDFRVRLDCTEETNWERETARLHTLLEEPESRTSSFGDRVSWLSVGEFTYPIPSYFVGRQDILDQLLKAIEHDNVIVLCGMAGIGKTSLAAMLAETLKETYPALWLDCKSYGQLELALVRVAEFLTQRFGDHRLAQLLQSPTASAARRTEVAITSLDAHQCLFIWDQFDQSKNQLLIPLLEMGSQSFRRSRLLITTREWLLDADLLNQPCRITLPGLDKESGLALMRYYLMHLGLLELPDELLCQIYERLNGHPYFLRQLMILAETFPLPDLLDKLPYFTNQAYTYIQQQVLGNLTPIVQQLLTKLTILRVPFQISAVACLADSSHSYNAFDVLLRKFVITRQREDGAFYEIHSLVREWCKTQGSTLDLPAIHRKAMEYYQALPEKRYLDAWELVHHALEANMLDEAADAANHLLGYALYDGRYNLVLDSTSQLLQDTRTERWSFVHYVRGRALRFKECRQEALEEYQMAMALATMPKDRDAAKFEIASVLTMLAAGPEHENWQMAEDHYTDLLDSEDSQIRVQALNSLGLLKAWGGHPEEGVEKILDALDLAEEAGWRRHVAASCYGLGTVYGDVLNEPQEAIQYLERSLSIRKEIGSESGGQDIEAEYHTLDALAHFYNEVGHHPDAAQANAQCVEIDRKLELEHRLAHSLYHLGREQCLLGQFELAYQSLKESLELVWKHDIQEGAERAILEWRAVILWHLRDFQGAVECILEYISVCERDGVPSERHVVVKKSELLPDANLLELSRKGLHVLVLPNEYGWDDIQSWTANIVKRRPDLAAVSRPLFLQKPQIPPREPRIGRNDPCPCGSGKKYKYCCGKRPR